MKLTKLARHGLCVFTSIVVTGIPAGCGGQAGGMNKGKLVEIAVCISSQTPASMVMREVFKPRLEELTGGEYDIQIYGSGILGSEKVIYGYTRSGIIEMRAVGTPIQSETSTMAVPDFPFVFQDVEYARRYYQGQLGGYIAEELEADQPVTLMSRLPNGARAFSSNKKLAKLGDFKRQKPRMLNDPIHVKLAESLGVNMAIMDMGEVFIALEQGVTDGQDSPLLTVKNEGWYEAQDYIYDTSHIVASLESFAGDRLRDSIDKVDREISRQVADEASDYAWDFYIDQLAGSKQLMKGNGLTVIDLSDRYRGAMKIKIQPVYDYLDEEYEWAGTIRKMIEGIEQGKDYEPINW